MMRGNNSTIQLSSCENLKYCKPDAIVYEEY